MEILFKKLHPDAVVPKPAHGYHEDAGADLVSIERWTLYPGETHAFGTGIAISLPPGYEAQIRSRSGLSFKHSIHVLNSPGTGDPGYRGEIKVILHNSSRVFFSVNPGDRIAQLVVAKYEAVDWMESDELSSTNRGYGGIGSTGVN